MLTETQIKHNKKRFIKLLESTNRPGIKKLIDALDTNEFFIKAASRNYHSNFDGGLCSHSLNMYDIFVILKTLSGNKFFTFDTSVEPLVATDSIKIACLLHDACKIMKYNKFHGVSSVNFIKRYIKLTEQEELMIKYHMGQYGKEYPIQEYIDITNKHKEIKLLHWADDFSSNFNEDIRRLFFN